MILQNLTFSWILIMSILMAISSSFWFAFWMALEINMMIFIPMMNSKNFLSSNSMIYYYMIQSMASSLFFFSSIFSFYFNNKIFILIIVFSMMIKLAAAPLHSWYPQISDGLNYFSFFILSTMQKMIPLFIITFYNSVSIIIFIIFSSLIGSLGGFNQTSLKKILAYSSITHLSWILTLIMMSQNFWVIYFLIYSFILLKIIFLLKKNEFSLIVNLNLMKVPFLEKLFLLTLLLSLGGMPPFLGFLTKWMSVILIVKKLPLILLFLIMSSLVNLFFYTRLMFPLVLNFNILMKTHLSISLFSSMKMFPINMMSIVFIIPFMMLM
uniref:NADH dehydrogenase subunit 2 n=1 Tax=Ixodes loricatus TaxID=59649 RepID=UPI00286A37C7|nr:NADH dehydrogenase subunit 2 [Ixodes loricatus]WKW95212.1 NADH dehydrogenase subunit 2 [Ixodes loricatus]